MAVQIEVNYSKKLGLPGYSSHQFAITVRKEITDVAQVEKEGSQLYRLLQDSVDREIQEAGFVPGLETPEPAPTRRIQPDTSNDSWRCSDKQRDLILKVIAENKLVRGDVEALSQERFGVSLPGLNKLQASGLIDELLEKHGGHEGGRGQSRRPSYPKGGAR